MQSYGLWEYHKNKEVIRSFVLPQKPIQNGIWLPSNTCCCVKKAEANGFLKMAHSVLLVERDKNIFIDMKANAPKIRAVKCVCGKLEKVLLLNKIDYAYFDFLGGLNKPVSIWMNKVLSPNICQDATIAITQIYATRGSKIIPEQENFLYKSEGSEIRQRYGIIDIHMQKILILLHRIFCIWDFDIETINNQVPIYSDMLHKMMVFKLINFRKPNNFLFCSL